MTIDHLVQAAREYKEAVYAFYAHIKVAHNSFFQGYSTCNECCNLDFHIQTCREDLIAAAQGARRVNDVRSVSGSQCFSINVSHDGTYACEYVDNDYDLGEIIYDKDWAKIVAFMATKLGEAVRRGFV